MSAGRGRRWLLAVTLVAGTEPLVKMSRAEAQYQDTPRGGLNCAGCALFRRLRCTVVEGDISPSGWCRLFDLPD
jgi:hypothetical protein